MLLSDHWDEEMGTRMVAAGTEQTRVLITDGAERAALAAARSLLACGCQVHVGARHRLSLASVCRGVRSAVLAIEPLEDPAGYAAAVGRLAARLGARLVLPVTDP